MLRLLTTLKNWAQVLNTSRNFSGLDIATEMGTVSRILYHSLLAHDLLEKIISIVHNYVPP